MDYNQQILIECVEQNDNFCEVYDVGQLIIPLYIGISLIISIFFFFRVLEYVRNYYRKPKS